MWVFNRLESFSTLNNYDPSTCNFAVSMCVGEGALFFFFLQSEAKSR